MDSYHHGNLADALLEAAETLIEEVGLDALSIRACAKAVGVTHSAAFRHYKNKQHLLTALAARSANAMADFIDQQSKQAVQSNQSLEVGMAYIGFAIANPNLFRLVFREEIIDAGNQNYRNATRRLADQLGDSRTERSSAEPLSDTALLAWSAVHGMACLSVDGSLASDVPYETRLQIFRRALSKLRPVLSA